MSKQNTKVLLTGASGLLGRQVLSHLTAEGVPCTGLCFSRPREGLYKLDITDFAATRSFVQELQPTMIIHAAAQRFPDKVESDLEASLKLNVEATRNLAEVCKEVGSRLIYISTDYVFDGGHPPFFHDNKPNPLNKYGETKLAGEEAVLSTDPTFLVLRIPVLYGGVKTLNESAVTVLLEVIRSGKPTKMSSYEVRCPSHTQDIARILLDMIRKSPEGGIYQWCGLEKLSKWDMCKIISKETGLDIGHLEEVVGAGGTPRPRDVELDREKLRRLGIEHHTQFKEGVMGDLKQFL
eukprot:GFUD01027768.1.p1 GENE.GFUD01027768.1~~GFUD01027768.1.p1  ORF type:complete len:294 (+),score=81.21 GFUD01027768.1:32-913(+)